MTRKKVLFAELNVNRGVLPLVSGYLQSYACTDPEVARGHDFVQFGEPVPPRSLIDVPEGGGWSAEAESAASDLLGRLLAQEADVYALSVYVWNARLVRWLVDRLSRARPSAQLLLGGPQVDSHGAEFVQRDRENVYVCNGEGEAIFLEFLRAGMGGTDPSHVPGLTFFRDGEIVETARPPLIKDINDIPSPYLTGVFRDVYTMTVFETNRGCPYLCSFCYWGRGDDRSLRKFEMDRLREELAWVGRNMVSHLHLGDANWGILPRDIELSEEIVRCRERYGAPIVITFSAAKAKIDRSSKIAKLFHDAGIVTAQAIGIQSTTDAVLDAIRRKNIKLSALMEASEELERNNVSTYAETIWPLPGETYESFKECLRSLCASSVTSVVIYPALLLNSTPMEDQVEEFDIRTVDADDPWSELRLISSTSSVSEADNEEGVWLAMAVYCLFNCRTMRLSGRYLEQSGLEPWSDLFEAFSRFCRNEEDPINIHWREVVAERSYADQHSVGRLVHLVLHERRVEFLDLLRRFAASRAWWSDDRARVLFELDLVNCPYLYSTTPFQPAPMALPPFEHFSVLEMPERTAQVEVDPDHLGLVTEAIGADDGIETWNVSYQRRQFAFMASKPMPENYTYAYGMIHRNSVIAPVWAPR